MKCEYIRSVQETGKNQFTYRRDCPNEATVMVRTEVDKPEHGMAVCDDHAHALERLAVAVARATFRMRIRHLDGGGIGHRDEAMKPRSLGASMLQNGD